MREVVLALSALISTAALLCLCVFVAQMTVLKKVDWLYGKLCAGHDNGWRSVAYPRNIRRSLEKAYCYLGVLGFLFCIGAGSYHLLWWMPRSWGWLDSEHGWVELRAAFALISALLVGCPIVNFLFNFIELKTKQSRLLEEVRVLEFEADGYRSLLECGDNLGTLAAIQARVEAECKRILDFECAEERWGQRQRLTRVVEIVKDRVESSQALEDARREAEERVQREREQAAAQSKREEREKLQKALSAAQIQRPLAKSLDCVSAGSEVLLHPAVAKHKWQALHELGMELKKVEKRTSISALLKPIPGVQTYDDVAYEVEFRGVTLGTGLRNGYSETTSTRNGQRGDLLDGLFFEPSLDGLLAAFFLRIALPGYLAWDHGFYGRDQKLVFSLEEAVALLEWDCIAPDNAGLQAVTVPAGLRVCRDDAGTLTMSCLTYVPGSVGGRGSGFCDYAVSVSNGRASSVRDTMLFEWGGYVLY